ncbi:MAG: hypothetical protein KDD94_09960, partial [Calditrichaeota bacterium]|nr:hypothetical protein [Calditrichota bacterium]
MIYREIEPQAHLKPFIMKYWTFALEGKTKVDADGYRDHHFLPDGCLNLVVFKDHGHNVMRLSGPQLVNYTVRVHKHIYYMGIRFHPATIEALFDVKASDLIGKNIDPTPLMPPEIVETLFIGYDRNNNA